jgi:hypothetical protein
MTFYEAAIEVLRRTGRPLHFKKITEIAVREDLLSHVGREPDETMSKRLEKEVKKNDQTAIDQKRPGVFQLLDEERAKEIIERVEQKQKERRERSQDDQQAKSSDTSNSSDHQRSRDTGGDSGNQQSGEDAGSRRQARGSKANKAKKTRKKERSSGPSDDKKRKRSRTRKRTRSDDGGDDQKRRRRRRRSDSDGDDQKKQRQDEDQQQETPKRTRSSSQEGNDTAPPTGTPSVPSSSQTHLEEGPVRLEGIPKAAYKVLDENGGGAIPIDDLAERIFDQKLVKFHTHDPVTTVKSALANDNQIRADRGHRPLFDHDDAGNWWLTKRALSEDVYQKEQTVLSLTEEIRQASMEQLGDKLRNIAPEALEYLALTLLERLGYYNIKVSKRSSDGDVFFTADWRQGMADVRVCVRVVTDSNRTLKRDAVDDLRETLDHYSASEGVVIHLGDIADQAVDGARLDGEAPITLFDSETFVELLVKHGIGVETYRSPIVTVDTEFIDALGN